MTDASQLGSNSVVPVVVTPFTGADEVDVPAVEHQSRYLRELGCTWAAVGYGSEADRLTPGELAEVTAAVVNGGLRVVGNVELASEPAAVASARWAVAAGASMVMVRPAGWGSAPVERLGEAIAMVADGSGVPVLLQDAPQHTGVDLPVPALVTLLAETAGLFGVKVEPPASVDKIARLRREVGAGVPILGGLGGQFVVHELEAGADGTMPGPAFVEVFQAIAAAVGAGRVRQAWQLHAWLLPFIVASSTSMDAFLVQQKHVLVEDGVIASARIRMPYGTATEEIAARHDRLAEHLDLAGLRRHCHTMIGPNTMAHEATAGTAAMTRPEAGA